MNNLPATQIIAHIPFFVWGILALILVMGLKQSRTNAMSRARLVVLPLFWLVFSAWGVEKSFGASAATLLPWLMGVLATLALMLRAGWPGAVRYDDATGRYIVPGSWLPLVVMLGIFVGKFAIGMSLAIQPALATATVFAGATSLVFGLFSGFFLGRAVNIVRRAVSSGDTAAATLSAAA